MTSIFRRHARGRPPHPDVLTPAEWRVLDEVRGGRSNPEIAERLGLSRNTVKTHISNILDKLELNDRSDIAMWGGRPAPAQRSPLFAPLAWVAGKSEVVVMSAVATLAVTGVVVAMQSGLLTDSPPEVSVAPAATATEVVSTPAAGAPIPDCPVLDEVCALAVEFLPLMRAGDGQAIAARATTQKLACPDVVAAWAERMTEELISLCGGASPPSTINVFEFNTGKGPVYLTSSVAFADEVRAALGGMAHGAPPRIVAVGCRSDVEGLPLDCARGAMAVYVDPESASPATPSPAAPGSFGLAALVFSRTAETGLWRVEKVWMPYPGVLLRPILDGTQVEIFTGGGIREVSLFGYDFG